MAASIMPPIAIKDVRIGLWRRFQNSLAIFSAVLFTLIVLAPLAAILGYLLYKGIGSVNVAFLTQTPKPVGEAGGGMANAIVGSMMILGIASLIGLPLGIGTGIYLAEFGYKKFGNVVRFTAASYVRNSYPTCSSLITAESVDVSPRKNTTVFRISPCRRSRKKYVISC